LTRHDAIHAIGAVISGDMFATMKGNVKTWNPKSYDKRRKKLTAKRWRQGKW